MGGALSLELGADTSYYYIRDDDEAFDAGFL